MKRKTGKKRRKKICKLRRARKKGMKIGVGGICRKEK